MAVMSILLKFGNNGASIFLVWVFCSNLETDDGRSATIRVYKSMGDDKKNHAKAAGE